MPLLVGSRRAVLSAPSRRVVAFDLFTDANGTALESHVASDGGAWAKNPISGAGSITIDNNRIHNTNDATLHVSYHSWSPVSADYLVSAAFVRRSTSGTDIGICARLDASANTYYLLRYNMTIPGWQMYKVVAGVTTQLGSTVGQTLTVDQDYLATLSVIGSTIVASVDGLAIISVTDTAITAAGHAGVRTNGAAQLGIGLHLDTFQVVQ